LNTAQIVARKGAVDNIEKARKEAARPDGYIEVNDMGDGPVSNTFQFNTRTDLAQSHYLFWQESKNSIDLKGPNATQMGNKAQGASSASGKAIIASQQGGMVALGDLLDNLRHLDLRVFRAIYYLIRQYWTAPRWVRVTDDDRNIKWVAMNMSRDQLMQMSQGNPQAMQQIAGAVANVAELDCDIIIEPGPEGPAQVNEQFEALVQLKQMDANGEIPLQSIIRAFPNPQVKQRVIKDMQEQSQPSPEKQAAMKLEMAGAEAKVKQTEADANLKTAQAQATLAGIGAQPQDNTGTEMQTEVLKHSMTLQNKQSELQMQTEAKREQAMIDRETELQKHKMSVVAKTATSPDEIEEATINGAERKDARLSALLETLNRPKQARKLPDGSYIVERL
jgi:hypothetical protein